MPDLQAFPASAASSLLSGYCSDFIDLAATMAQTLEQVKMRGLDIGSSQEQLARVEKGMRALADAIGEVLGKLEGGKPQMAPRTASTVSKETSNPATVASRPVPAAPAKAATQNMPAPRAELAARPTAPTSSAPALRSATSAAAAAPSTTTATPVPGELQGSTETLPMRSVFQFLGRTRKTGHLHVTVGKEKVRFEFVDGCMVGTSSTASPTDELLSSILVRLGVVTPTQIESHVKQHGDGRQRLGAALVQSRLITESQLADAVDLQTAQRFQRVVAQQQASFVFEPEAEHTERGIRIRSRATPDAKQA
jgi:hypothetical protein